MPTLKTALRSRTPRSAQAALWMNEDYRMAIFDAVALALARFTDELRLVADFAQGMRCECASLEISNSYRGCFR